MKAMLYIKLLPMRQTIYTWYLSLDTYCYCSAYDRDRAIESSLVVAMIMQFNFMSSIPGQNGGHFEDYIFKCIFMTENFCMSIIISVKFDQSGPIDNKAALIQVMAWRRTGVRPLPEPIITQFIDAHMRQWGCGVCVWGGGGGLGGWGGGGMGWGWGKGWMSVIWWIVPLTRLNLLMDCFIGYITRLLQHLNNILIPFL